MPQLTYASVFSGIGGMDVGFARAGWDCRLLCEINPEARTVLARHFPGIPTKGDIRDVQGHDIAGADALVGGPPCQDTSVGQPNRLGLAGARSGLFWEFARIAEQARPEWVVIENPPGLLTSPGRGKNGGPDRTGADAAAVFRALEDLGYGWAYRVVDGQHLGTPQRRRRTFVVGHHRGDPATAWAVLGDHRPGCQVAAPTDLRTAAGFSARPDRPRGDHGVTDRPVIWRKRARARAKLDAGGYETWERADFANTLAGFDGGGPLRQTHLVAQRGHLRTLTLTEWERLQGLPDGWTEGISTAGRYLALGNAVHTGTAHWLARRLALVTQVLRVGADPAELVDWG